MFLRLRARGGAPWRLQGDSSHHGWGVFAVLSRFFTDSYMKKGGQIKMSTLTFFPPGSKVVQALFTGRLGNPSFSVSGCDFWVLIGLWALHFFLMSRAFWGGPAHQKNQTLTNRTVLYAKALGNKNPPKNTPRPWRPLTSHGRHGDPPPAPRHTASSQHSALQVYVV